MQQSISFMHLPIKYDMHTKTKKPNHTIFAYLLVMATVSYLSCSSPSSYDQLTSTPHSDKYGDILQKGIDRGFPGIILAVKKTNEDLWVGASGVSNIEQHKLMLSNDRFHLASITKIFTAVAVLKLIDEGKLELKNKAINYLDSSLVNPIPYIDKIEIGQLLDHSSGIYSFNNDMEYIETLIGDRAFEEVKWSPEQLIALAYGERVEPQGEPGSGHYYGDTNYILLGLIIEKISGRPFRRFIKENILDPLALKNTGFYSATVNKTNVELSSTVQGYLKRSEDLDGFITIHPSFKEVSAGLVNTSLAGEKIDAGAGMVSTAKDLMKFGTALYSGSLLSSQSLNWLLSIGENIEKEEINTK